MAAVAKYIVFKKNFLYLIICVSSDVIVIFLASSSRDNPLRSGTIICYQIIYKLTHALKFIAIIVI